MATVRERYQAVMLHGDVSKGIPILEWAPWWKLTRDNWVAQGMPSTADPVSYFGLERIRFGSFSPMGPNTPKPAFHGAGLLTDENGYEQILPSLYQLHTPDPARMDSWRAEQERGDVVIRVGLHGPFWHPRRLFGIEAHLLAFYDNPDLMKRINEDLAEFCIRQVDFICQYFIPDFITFAEDMSYNHGPMISYEAMDEFMAPFYRRVMPEVLRRGSIPIIDSDGQIEPLIPWFRNVGLQGILPLERMAGVDVNRIRENHPDWRMVGGFDKTIMHKGEAALRAEFQRIKPAVMQGYFIPSVDHQTPPAVSIDDYLLYVRLLREFSDEVAAEASKR